MSINIWQGKLWMGLSYDREADRVMVLRGVSDVSRYDAMVVMREKHAAVGLELTVVELGEDIGDQLFSWLTECGVDRASIDQVCIDLAELLAPLFAGKS